MQHPHFHVITGASGAGKSTLLAALGERGYSVVPEVALTILQEQEAGGGNLCPRTQPQAFMAAVCQRSIQVFDAARHLSPPVFFDRGLPECLGHMRLLGLQAPPGFEAELRLRRYARTVFVARPWPEIYVRDRWRQADFERAARSFEPTVLAYTDDGYAACVVPQVSVAERVEFILRQLDAGG